MKCSICENSCTIREGEYGRCRMYTNINGKLVERFPDQYSTLFPISIETMPTLHFYPNHKFLQVSSIGCNFSCSGCISEILAKENGLLIGFSTNGYFTRTALEMLIPLTDFVNIGIKGFSDAPYKSCGVESSNPVFRNLEQLFEAGVHVEVAAIHMKGFEDEIRQVADFTASLSKNVPFQIMRFIPFGEADIAYEPTIKESEALCAQLKKQLTYIYLFNSPGTELLNTFCPDCGTTVISREFFGPMGSRITQALPDATCTCGRRPDIKGPLSPHRYDEHGFFGGYRTTRAFEMLHAVMVCIGADDPKKISDLWSDIIKTNYLKEFHDTVQLPEQYGGIIDWIAQKTGCIKKGNLLKAYIRERLDQIRSTAAAAERPQVYYAMGYPLFALNAERFETNLVEVAGGTCLNKGIKKKGKPGVTISKTEFVEMNPQIIFISGFLSCPVSDFYDYCIKNNLMVDAVTNNRIYDHFPLWDFGSPRWILGLMHIANILHPELFQFDMENEANQFYSTFFNTSFNIKTANRSFYRVG